MAERLRALLERPLDPFVSRAVLILALAVGAGLALSGGLGAGPPAETRTPTPTPPREVVDGARVVHSPNPGLVAGQDAQDRSGTTAHRRATREVAEHRALQHVPYRVGALSVKLVGVLRGRAVLQVEAPTIGAVRRGWRLFLRRFEDSGRAYVPRLESGGRHGR